MKFKLKYSLFGSSKQRQKSEKKHAESILQNNETKIPSSYLEIKSYVAIRFNSKSETPYNIQTKLFKGNFDKLYQWHLQEPDKDNDPLPPMYFPILADQNKVAYNKDFERSTQNIYIVCLDCEPNKAEQVIRNGEFHKIIVGLKHGSAAYNEAKNYGDLGLPHRNKVKHIARFIENPYYGKIDLELDEKSSVYQAK